MGKPIILVDFDGVIHSYKSGWKGMSNISDEPNPGAIEWLKKVLPTPEPISHFISEPPVRVMIYSSRSKNLFGRQAMKKWFKKYLGPEYLEVLKFPLFKPAAFLTIDDRCICFNGTFPTIQDILEFKPWNKRGV